MKTTTAQAKTEQSSHSNAGSNGAAAAPPSYGIDFLDRQREQPNRTGLPDQLKAGVESLSGISMDSVRVHYNSTKPAQLQALAYTQGTDIHVGAGQEKHLAHEAWHVVQQAQGRVKPTLQAKGMPVNDDQRLEREADVMGGKAARIKTDEKMSDRSSSKEIVPVIQRAMGMEVETRRAVVGPDGKPIDKGDTPLLTHQYFNLVTDHFNKYSNLEFVMKHFDQLAGTENEAIAKLNERITAMQNLATTLYAGTGKIGNIPGVGTQHNSIYTPQSVDKTKPYSSTEASIAEAKNDDKKLYVHYTVGFEPKDWFKMVKDIHEVTRSDTTHSRPKTHAGHAITAIPDVLGKLKTNLKLTDVEHEELRGHLAIMYMQMSVFTERTMELQIPSINKQYVRAKKEVTKIQTQIDEINKDGKLNLLEKDERINTLKQSFHLNHKEKILKKIKNKLTSIDRQKEYGKGQPKNKIAALPRATLNQMFDALSANTRAVLSSNEDTILEAFSEHLEKTLKLDFNEYFELENEELKVAATLEDYLKAGLGSGQHFTQQVLFGGMNEVGIDASIPNKKLFPLEFRSIYKHRISWDELKADAVKILKWSRNPQQGNLAG